MAHYLVRARAKPDKNNDLPQMDQQFITAVPLELVDHELDDLLLKKLGANYGAAEPAEHPGEQQYHYCAADVPEPLILEVHPVSPVCVRPATSATCVMDPNVVKLPRPWRDHICPDGATKPAAP